MAHRRFRDDASAHKAKEYLALLHLMQARLCGRKLGWVCVHTVTGLQPITSDHSADTSGGVLQRHWRQRNATMCR